MGAKKLARTKAEGDEKLRENTAKDWRVISGPSPRKAKKKAAEPLREGTAKDWRKAVAKKEQKKAAGPLRSGTAKDWRKAASASGQSKSRKRKTEKMRGSPSRD